MGSEMCIRDSPMEDDGDFRRATYTMQDPITGDECTVKVCPMDDIHPHSKVLVYIPGRFGFEGNPEADYERPPKPAICVYIEIVNRKGKRAKQYSRPLPPLLIRVLQVLRRWAGVNHQREVIAIGFSRGASWLASICMSNASLIDGAWLFATYPTHSGDDRGTHEAQVLMRSDFPVVVVQFAGDPFCNSVNYQAWYTAMYHAALLPPGVAPGTRSQTFYFLECPGDHNTGAEIIRKLDFESPNELKVLWRLQWVV